MRMNTLCIVVLTSALVVSHANAGLVTNGNFESASTTPAAGYKLQLGSQTTLTGWNVDSNPSYLYLDTPGSATNGYDHGGYGVYGPFKDSPTGGMFIQADCDPRFHNRISQTLTGLTVGAAYKISFYQAAGQQSGFVGPTTEYWKVGFGSSTQNSSVYSLPSGGVGAWQAQSLTFVADAATQVLSFLAQGTPTNLPPTVFLDGVDVELATPEPSSIVSVGLGILATAAVRFRRRRSA